MGISPKRVSPERGLRRGRKEPVDGTHARDVQVRGSEPRRFFAGQSGAQLRFAKLDGANLDGATLHADAGGAGLRAALIKGAETLRLEVDSARIDGASAPFLTEAVNLNRAYALRRRQWPDVDVLV